MGITTIGTSAFPSTLSYILVFDNESEAAYKAANPNLTNLFRYMFKYTLQNDGTYSIGKGTYNLSGTLNIPSTFNGKAVSKIEDSAFYNCTGVTSVTIPSSIKSIGSSAFSGCTGLTSITIPSSVTSIGILAFSSCSSLKSVIIASSVTNIGSSAFSGCSSLTGITLSGSLTSIESSTFSRCSALTSITIPASVISIAPSAFEDCSSLASISVNSANKVYKSAGNCVIQISDNILVLGCKSSVIPSYVKAIGNSAFYNCTALTSITIPSSVTNIDSYAFSGCSKLTKVTIPSSVTNIGSCAFRGCSAIKSVSIPNSVTTIGSGAFSFCNALTSINISASVSNIAINAFQSCNNLTTITVDPNNSVYIGDGNCIIHRFNNFLVLGCVGSVIPNYVTAIGPAAFINSAISELVIPTSVQSIGTNAFASCRFMTRIVIPSSVSRMGSNVFEGWNENQTVYCNAQGSAISGWNRDWAYDCHANIVYSNDNIDKLDFIFMGDSYAVTGKREYEYVTSTITIPSFINGYPVKHIVAGAFHDFVNLTEVYFLPDSQLEVIGSAAFADCISLTSINIPSTVRTIENGAFIRCNNLKYLIIPSSVLFIGPQSFVDSSTGPMTIYTDAPSAPQNWQFLGNVNCYIYWDCTFSENYEYVKSIVVQADNNGLKNAPRRNGLFVQWDLGPKNTSYQTTDIIKGAVPSGIRIYAVWVPPQYLMSNPSPEEVEILSDLWDEVYSWYSVE
ncbi:MAG: leucine-rich repeat domain-containing protein [Clostridiales bacterium]|nr:leucine-rich repeat domain-containing protein [Clostridiales bacterium]